MGISYNPTIITSNLQICLDWGNTKCFPGSGTNFTNIINSSVNDGYIKNNVTYSSSNGGYLSTGGANNGQTNNVGDRIDINTSAAGRDRFSGTHNFSIFFWNYYISGAGRIFATGSAGTGTENSDNCIWQMWINSFSFFWWNSSGGSANSISCSFNGNISTNTWQYIGFTYSYNEDGNNIVRLYKNGSLVNSTSISTATHSFIDRSNQSNLQWTLGGGYSSSCFTSNSVNRFGPFYLYNKTLTTQEIQQNFNATRSRFSI
jgi:hypothetical protein